jgi:DNA ligase-1
VTLLAEVVQTSAQVAATPSRLAKTEALAGLLRRLTPRELEIAIALLSGEARQGRLAVATASLFQAAAGASAGEPLTLQEVDGAFQSLKESRGKGSAERKQQVLRDLFMRAMPEERDFLVRLIVGELRQGALEGVMLEAVARAAGLPAADVRRAATLAGGIAPAALAALHEGPEALARFSVRLMQPVLPMLAQPAADPASAIDALGKSLLEWKLDGARVQVHKADDDTVKVFTRSLKEVTAAVPEVVAAVREAPGRSVILDGEAIALRDDGSPHSFQTTMRRFGRKLDDESVRGDVPLSVFFFDCMYADGLALVDQPLEARRAALERAVAPRNITPATVAESAEQAEAFYAEALRRGHEGIMAKALGAPYEAGRRGASWLKVKRAHTLDLVVLAAEWGHGRRRGRLSNLHLGARDAERGGFVMLGKTFKGLTDSLLAWQTRELLARETDRDEWTVRVRPELVVEIAFNDIQQSPQYPGGMALRFARVKRYRPDKQVEEADTVETVRRLFEAAGPR